MVIYVVISTVMLVVFYALPLQISQSYQNTVKAEAQLVQELSSTNLSILSKIMQCIRRVNLRFQFIKMRGNKNGRHKI